jgi:agmatine deiminase
MNKSQRRLPAEWEPQRAVLIAFPHEGADWPGKYTAIQWAFIDFIKKISLYEKVILVNKSQQLFDKIRFMLEKAHVDLHQVEPLFVDTNRSWMRDSGPVIVKYPDGSLEALQFNFNGWAKYGNYRKDRHVPPAVAKHLNLPLTEVRYKGRKVILEGGAIDSNGKGTLITTEECLLDSSIQVRNPGFMKADYEKVFTDFMGITNVIWLGKGIGGDDTHGHIDDICRFVNPKTVIACREKNRKDGNYKPLEENIERLQTARLENGERLEVIELPMPTPIDFEDLHLPASYANFLIINGCVLVPTFNDKNDRIALGILSEAFHGREVIGISAIDLIWGLGTLHCLSHEIPY